ncbi:MAG: DUF2442 domain-containing protein [Gemmatimonadaceae bacterium]
MLNDILDAHVVRAHTLHLRFADGTEGDVDISRLVDFTGVFAALRDPREFAKVAVHPELKTVIWPNGADLDPDVLYAVVTGRPVEHGSEPPSTAGPHDADASRAGHGPRAVREPRRRDPS